MAESYYPFDSGPGTAVAEDRWGRMAKNWLTPSVIGSTRSLPGETSLAVTLGSGLTFNMAAGEAFIRGYHYYSDATVAKTAANNVSAQARIDRLVLRLDTNANTITPTIIQGTPGASPTPPALNRTPPVWDLALARATCPGSASAQNYSNLVIDAQWRSGVIVEANSTALDLALSPGDLWHRPDLSGHSQLVFFDKGLQIRGLIPAHFDVAAGAGSTSGGTGTSLCNFTISDPGYPYYILAEGAAEVSSPAASRGDLNCRLGSAGGAVISNPGLGVEGALTQAKALRKKAGPYTGVQTVHLVLDRVYGSGTITSSGFNGTLGIDVIPAW